MKPCTTAAQSRELDYYHDATRPGFFSLLYDDGGEKLRQKCFKMGQLGEFYRACDLTRDVYLSQAEFIRPSRLKIDVARIAVNFIDLDYYNTQWRGHTPEKLAVALLIHCNDHGILPPSAIISSGRGLNCKWYFESPIPRRALLRWDAVQTELVAKFADFGADPKAKDASRVLRLEHSVNSKCGKTVEIINPFGREPHLYDFEALARELLPWDRKGIRDKQTERKLQLETKRHHTKQVGDKHYPGLRPLSTAQLCWDRLADLRTLAALRGGVQHGQRDTFLFLAGCFLAWTVEPEQLQASIEQIALEFAPGFSVSEVRGYTSSVIKRAQDAKKGEQIIWQGHSCDPRYRFKNCTLIELLQITPAEEQQLQTIISDAEKRRRDANRHRQKRRMQGAVARETYLQAAEDRKASARLMRAQGMSVEQIAAMLDVSRRTAFNYL